MSIKEEPKGNNKKRLPIWILSQTFINQTVSSRNGPQVIPIFIEFPLRCHNDIACIHHRLHVGNTIFVNLRHSTKRIVAILPVLDQLFVFVVDTTGIPLVGLVLVIAVGLSMEYRVAFEMNRLEGHSLEEVAARLGVSVRTIERYRDKALAILQKELKDYLPLLLLLMWE